MDGSIGRIALQFFYVSGTWPDGELDHVKSNTTG
jgi:hypothetical protein